MYAVSRIRRKSTSIFAVAFTLSLLVNCIAPLPLFARASSGVRSTRADYKRAIEVLERFVTHEMADKDLPAVSIALVDDQQIVWAKGFGFADPVKKYPPRPRPFIASARSRNFLQISRSCSWSSREARSRRTRDSLPAKLPPAQSIR
jgi:hypothetical protein